jgi:hypothetical protein
MILLLNYYFDSSAERQKEYNTCLYYNCRNDLIKKIYLFSDEKIKPLHEKIVIINSKRPTYLDFFEFGNTLEGIKIVSNLDIILQDLTVIKNYDLTNTVLAISRDDSRQPDSQDVWVWNGEIKTNNEMDFYLGIAGCDNRIAYELEQQGYTLLNPCKSIKCVHLHNTEKRNYIKDGIVERIPGHYKLILPQ